jgi:hypothetical protein
MIIPKPRHSYQLIPLGLDGIDDPITVAVGHISCRGEVAFDWISGDRSGNTYAMLSNFVLMIEKEVPHE